MALIRCSECGKEVSDKAAACPNCGAPLDTNSQPPNLPIRKRPSFFALALLGVLVILLGGGFLYWRATTSQSAAPPSAGLAGALRESQTVVREKTELNEGAYKVYSFSLSSDSRIHVKVGADPQPVDVMLMGNDEAQKFSRVQGQLFGGQYTYRQALSSKHVLSMDKTEVLPRGSWAIVLLRPREHVLFQKSTAVNVVITAF